MLNTSNTSIEQLVRDLLFGFDADTICNQIEEMYEGYISRDIHRQEGDQLMTYHIAKDLKELITKAETIIKEAKNAPNLPPVTPPPTSPLKVIKLKGELELTEERQAV